MAIQDLSKADCLRFVARTSLARLACAHQNQPYVIPVYLVYHDPYLYGFTTPGQKIEWMRYNPLVCVEMDEVADRDEWTSVIIFGHYEDVPDDPPWKDERMRAFEALQQHARWWEPGCAYGEFRGTEQPLTPVFYRIRIDRVTGRRALLDPTGPVQPGRPALAQANHTWLHTLLHALTAGRKRTRGEA
jgi:nitroimidazol reductase NimA-like FMN-containing flavoprotein (pyridoxamine 5'-phosphate oxidase superfamily)